MTRKKGVVSAILLATLLVMASEGFAHCGSRCGWSGCGWSGCGWCGSCGWSSCCASTCCCDGCANGCLSGGCWGDCQQVLPAQPGASPTPSQPTPAPAAERPRPTAKNLPSPTIPPVPAEPVGTSSASLAAPLDRSAASAETPAASSERPASLVKTPATATGDTIAPTSATEIPAVPVSANSGERNAAATDMPATAPADPDGTPTLAPPEPLKTPTPAVRPREPAKPASDDPFSLSNRGGSRLWTDVSGQYHVEARLVSFDGQTVRLQRADGRYVRIAVGQLCTLDAQFVRQQTMAVAASL
jgi:hypothetical protein